MGRFPECPLAWTEGGILIGFPGHTGSGPWNPGSACQWSSSICRYLLQVRWESVIHANSQRIPCWGIPGVYRCKKANLGRHTQDFRGQILPAPWIPLRRNSWGAHDQAPETEAPAQGGWRAGLPACSHHKAKKHLQQKSRTTLCHLMSWPQFWALVMQQWLWVSACLAVVLS